MLLQIRGFWHGRRVFAALVVALEAPFRTIRSETHIMPRRIREAFEHVNTGSHVQDRAALTRYRTSRVFVLRADFASNWEADFA